MKFCENCGAELADDAQYCLKCGCPTELFQPAFRVQDVDLNTRSTSSGIDVAIKIFMVIGCIFSAFFFLFPLIWTVPLTVYVFRCLNEYERIGTGYKVCIFLFVNMIAGILLFTKD